MRKLIKHNLDPKKCISYFKETLENTNIISKEITEIVNFETGNFFTLLPEDSALSRIYKFKSWILPQNPVINKSENKYQEISNIDHELSQYILQKIKRSKQLACIIDDVTIPLKYYELDDLFSKYGFNLNQEVYFFIDSSAPQEDVLKCLRASKSFWHSLCIIIKSELNVNKRYDIELKNINAIVREVILIVVGAYDGEGYILWERDELLN